MAGQKTNNISKKEATAYLCKRLLIYQFSAYLLVDTRTHTFEPLPHSFRPSHILGNQDRIITDIQFSRNKLDGFGFWIADSVFQILNRTDAHMERIRQLPLFVANRLALSEHFRSEGI